MINAAENYRVAILHLSRPDIHVYGSVVQGEQDIRDKAALANIPVEQLETDIYTARKARAASEYKSAPMVYNF